MYHKINFLINKEKFNKKIKIKYNEKLNHKKKIRSNRTFLCQNLKINYYIY